MYLLSRRVCRISATALPALAMVLVPALLMVSTIRFRSFKTIDLGWRRSYFVLFLAAVGARADRDRIRGSRWW